MKWIWQQDKWPDFDWDMSALQDDLSRVRLLQGRLLGNYDLIKANESLEAQLDVLLQNAISTYAIEGEKINVASVKSSIAKKIGATIDKTTRIKPQDDGVSELLLDATRNAEEKLDKGRLLQWHNNLFVGSESILYEVIVGEFREDAMEVVSGAIGRRKVHYVAPPPESLNTEIDKFINWFNNTKNGVDSLLRAGIAHLWFITIHPFDDGNGRIARAITDLALAQAEPTSIRFYNMPTAIFKRRNEYYHVLENTQKGSIDITLWLKWFLNTLVESLEDSIDRIQAVIVKARFWEKHSNTVLNERQLKVLNRLLDTAPDSFVGGITARKYMSLTKTSKATATRALSDLLDKGCLSKLDGGGRSTAYDINAGED